jgi:hypothetical protein
MAVKKVNDSSLTSVADAIRTKGGTSAQLYFPDGFIDAIEAIPTGGGDTFADIVFNGASTYSNDTVTTIPRYAFAGTRVTQLDMPNVTSIEQYAFYLSGLVNAVFNNISSISIGEYAFNASRSLRSVTMNEVTSMASYAFANCDQLSEITMPKLTDIGQYGFAASFQSATNKSFSFPNVETIRNYAFQSSYIEYISVPKLINLHPSAFSYSTLKEITIPSTCKSGLNATFNGCSSLKKVVFENNVKTLLYNSFAYCTALEEVDFSHCTAVPTNQGSNNFTSVPSTCVIKVPAALEADWKAATNWAAVASMIQGV